MINRTLYQSVCIATVAMLVMLSNWNPVEASRVSQPGLVKVTLDQKKKEYIRKTISELSKKAVARKSLDDIAVDGLFPKPMPDDTNQYALEIVNVLQGYPRSDSRWELQLAIKLLDSVEGVVDSDKPRVHLVRSQCHRKLYILGIERTNNLEEWKNDIDEIDKKDKTYFPMAIIAKMDYLIREGQYKHASSLYEKEVHSNLRFSPTQSKDAKVNYAIALISSDNAEEGLRVLMKITGDDQAELIASGTDKKLQQAVRTRRWAGVSLFVIGIIGLSVILVLMTRKNSKLETKKALVNLLFSLMGGMIMSGAALVVSLIGLSGTG